MLKDEIWDHYHGYLAQLYLLKKKKNKTKKKKNNNNNNKNSYTPGFAHIDITVIFYLLWFVHANQLQNEA